MDKENTMSIKDYSDEEIQKELERRQKEKTKVPEPIKNIDWSEVFRLVKEGIYSISEDGYEPKDFKHYIFETVMEAVYGKNIWKWWSNNVLG